jgi:hypothetical protein
MEQAMTEGKPRRYQWTPKGVKEIAEDNQYCYLIITRNGLFGAYLPNDHRTALRHAEAVAPSVVVTVPVLISYGF